jgi:hypothetical protein
MNRIYPRLLLSACALLILGRFAAIAQSIQSATLRADIVTEASWITQQQANCPNTPVDGAIAESTPSNGIQIIDAYRGNFAALGLVAAGSAYSSNVERWANWYMSHINWPDNLGEYATIYYYDIDPVGCTETSTGTYDAQDSWAATYLTFIAAWAKANPGTNSSATLFIQNNAYQLDAIANAALAMVVPATGLTGAKVNDTAQYLMDNSEVVQGFNSYSWVAANVLQDQSKAAYWASAATGINSAINNALWQACGTGFYCAAAGDGPHTWVPCNSGPVDTNYKYFWDSGLAGEAQVWPALSGVTPDYASTVFADLNSSCPTWKTLGGLPTTSPGYTLLPDSGIALAAIIAEDSPAGAADASTWLSATQTQWMTAHPWPWTVFDAGNTIRVANLLNGGTDPIP